MLTAVIGSRIHSCTSRLPVNLCGLPRKSTHSWSINFKGLGEGSSFSFSPTQQGAHQDFRTYKEINVLAVPGTAYTSHLPLSPKREGGEREAAPPSVSFLLSLPFSHMHSHAPTTTPLSLRSCAFSCSPSLCLGRLHFGIHFLSTHTQPFAPVHYARSSNIPKSTLYIQRLRTQYIENGSMEQLPGELLKESQ